MRALALGFIPLLACSGGGSYTPVETDTDTDGVDSDTEGVDTDTDLPETDDDGDGWSVEDGDCDDSTVWVNPSMPERKDDNLDNDCDGRTDEVFAGLRVFQSGVTSQILTVSPLGDVKAADTVRLSEPLGVVAAADDPVDGGFVVTDGSGKVAHVAENGQVTVWWDDSKTEYSPVDAPLGWFGGDWSPLGYYVLTGANRLWLVEPGKPATIALRWACLEPETNATDVCPLDVAVDPVTGVVGLFGYFGGFATWTPGDTVLTIEVYDNPLEPTHAFSKAGAFERSQGFYAYGSGVDGASTFSGIWRWNAEAKEFRPKGEWSASEWTVDDFVIEGESGDFYFTTHGGWDDNVYRMVGDGSYLGMLYTTAQDIPANDRVYGAVLVDWAEDP